MQPNLDNVFRFLCVDQEQITVNTTPTGDPLIVFSLDRDTKWPGGTFTLSKAQGAARFLTVFVTFKGASGGGCDIQLTGSNGGVSHHTISQGKKAVAARFYQFDLA